MGAEMRLLTAFAGGGREADDPGDPAVIGPAAGLPPAASCASAAAGRAGGAAAGGRSAARLSRIGDE